MNPIPVVFSMLVATGSYLWMLKQPVHHINAAPYMEAFAKRLMWACQTGKPIEINDGYWVYCLPGTKV